MVLINKHLNELPGTLLVCFILPVGVEQTLEEVMTIDGSKCATHVPYKTTVLFLFYFIKGVKGANSGNESSGHRNLDVIEVEILGGLLQRFFMFMFDVTEGISNAMDLGDEHPDFHLLVI